MIGMIGEDQAKAKSNTKTTTITRRRGVSENGTPLLGNEGILKWMPSYHYYYHPDGWACHTMAGLVRDSGLVRSVELGQVWSGSVSFPSPPPLSFPSLAIAPSLLVFVVSRNHLCSSPRGEGRQRNHSLHLRFSCPTRVTCRRT